MMKKLQLLPLIRIRAGKPLLAQISLRVHIKADQEYHSHAYAIRINGDVTELLVADKDRKLIWLNSRQLEVVDEELKLPASQIRNSE